jgi:hypothetical protein
MNMTMSRAIGSGLLGTGRTKWMVSIFYACNLLLAAAIAAPMYTAIADHVGNSAVGEQLAKSFSAAWLAEFSISHSEFLRGFSITVVYAGILFLALNTVLSAGAFEVFRQGEEARLHAFGRGMGKFFGRFARLAVVTSFLYFVVFWFLNGPVNHWLELPFRNSAVEAWHFYLNLGRVALLGFLVVVVNLMVEYAKADIVIHEHESSLAALGHGAGFVLRRFGQVLGIYVVLGLLTVGCIAVYGVFAYFFPQSSVLTIFFWFLVAQALLWLRWMFRLASWGAAVAYYGAHAPSQEAAAAVRGNVQAAEA